MNGYFRVAVGVPVIKVADVAHNANEIIKIIRQAKEKGVQMLVFPELCVTGASCGDLFQQTALIQAAEEVFPSIAQECEGLDCVMIGLPIAMQGNLYNCAAMIMQGTFTYVQYKTRLTLPEKRYFSAEPPKEQFPLRFAHRSIDLAGDFLNTLVFRQDNLSVDMAVVFGEAYTLAASEPLNVSSAGLIVHMDAAPETAYKKNERRRMLSAASGRMNGAYLYANAGYGESTTDVVYSGHSLICENGDILAESERFRRTSQLVYSDIDIEKIVCDRRRRGAALPKTVSPEGRYAVWHMDEKGNIPGRRIPVNPFLPEPGHERDELCEEILNIQKFGLITRMAHLNSQKLVVGVSGGLDSTLALLVCLFATQELNAPPADIIAVTMPGYGTSSKTYQNAIRLIRLLGATFREIPIAAACDQHFNDIGHDKRQDTTFENAQARERTQILLDIANMENGFVIGTGDFTELALGFATYNGDHMSNYCVNGNVPKTVIKEMIRWIRKTYFCENNAAEIGDILENIINTPISPELLPPDATGDIAQKTEEIVGSYELNDFFLYYVLKYGFAPPKIIFMAERAFQGKYEWAELIQRLKAFYRRFITQQFKRSCMPDGPAVYDFGFSPRGGYLIPSDACFDVWIKALDGLS